MFEYILKYLNNNQNKRLLIYCKNYNHKIYLFKELIIFLNDNKYYVEKYNKYIRIKNNSNEILIASSKFDLLGYSVDNFIIYGNEIDNNILSNIIFGNIGARKYFDKNIIFLRYFKIF